MIDLELNYLDVIVTFGEWVIEYRVRSNCGMK